MSRLDTKVLKKKKLDNETHLRVYKNEALQRISVEFSSDTFKMILQKSYQDTYEGRRDADEFSKTIKSTEDLKRYFGIKA